MPGLYTIGQQWQTSMGSSLLGFVGRDARNLAEVITSRRSTSSQEEPSGVEWT